MSLQDYSLQAIYGKSYWTPFLPVDLEKHLHDLGFDIANDPIRDIASEQRFLLFLTRSYKCYAIGENDYYQLGVLRKQPFVYKFTELKVFNGQNKQEKIVRLALGYDHTAIITANNNCYLFGRNNFGQLGFQSKKRKVFVPSPLKDLNVISVDCGQNHTIILTNRGRCYGFGYNLFGQANPNKKVEHFCTPSEIVIPDMYENENIISVACGEKHTVLLSSLGYCFTFGSNHKGQIGIKRPSNNNWLLNSTLNKVHRLTIINNGAQREIINFVSCGSNHTIILTQNKNCYGFGYNYYEQLALKNTVVTDTPTQIYFQKKIKTVLCKLDSTVFFMIDNEFKRFGTFARRGTEMNQLCLGEMAVVHGPNQMHKPYNWEILRLMLIVATKEKRLNSECQLARLPLDMIKLIVGQL